jgi:hypothetical protein
MGLKELLVELERVKAEARARAKELANAEMVREMALAAFLAAERREHEIMTALHTLAEKEPRKDAVVARKPRAAQGASYSAVASVLDQEPRRLAEIAKLASAPVSSTQWALKKMKDCGIAEQDEQLRWTRREHVEETGAES